MSFATPLHDHGSHLQLRVPGPDHEVTVFAECKIPAELRWIDARCARYDQEDQAKYAGVALPSRRTSNHASVALRFDDDEAIQRGYRLVVLDVIYYRSLVSAYEPAAIKLPLTGTAADPMSVENMAEPKHYKSRRCDSARTPSTLQFLGG